MARRKKAELNDNNLAIAYYRFSSHSQNEASIDQQRELAHDWADAHGFRIVKEYEDAAISGTTENRPGFQLMLSEVAKIRPRVLIMWKTDRLGRDKYVLAMAKRTIREAGCEIRLLAENIPTDGPEGVLIEGLMESMAEYYSRQLSQNIQRGMDYNAQHALYNGHKLFGYGVDKATKKYVVDPDTAPFVQRMFAEYAAGKAMQDICDELNAQGLRTTRGARFGVKTMNKMLQNRAYIGEYRHGDIVVDGGMPALVDVATFEAVQRKFAENKRRGSQRARGMDENEAPRYWLTGKLCCAKCGSPMQGVSGTSKTGRTYYYYYCAAQRRHECDMKKLRKDVIEDVALQILEDILDDSENLMSLAVDAAAYYEKNYRDTGYLDGLEAKRRDVEKSLANLVKVIESGVVSETVTERLVQLEEQKRALGEAIETENVRAALCEDEHSIRAYFEKFLHADFSDPEVRGQVLEYFVDKIYVSETGLMITSWYSGDHGEVPWEVYFEEGGNPFDRGEAVKFDCFPFGSTMHASRPSAPRARGRCHFFVGRSHV
ncbi:MAG: recombinase family protein [Atopobiaceae bacterium]|nr:recombinase family protein [Atopobiaceae bacterium]